MQNKKTSRALFSNIALLFVLLFSSSLYAEGDDARLYKISVLVFKHFPADKNTSPRLIDRWTEKDFANSIDVASLSISSSALAGSYYTLSRDKNYTILYSSAWSSPLEYGKPTTFHFHKTIDDNGDNLDGLIQMTLHYNLDVHLQTQLLAENKVIALDEIYQTPSNQLHYIDGPIYGALVLITRYDGK